MIDKFLCMVAGCALGTDVCDSMFKKRLTWFKAKKQDGPLRKIFPVHLYWKNPPKLFSKTNPWLNNDNVNDNVNTVTM